MRKAFTLVELIVVITILAILGTIAFISLQGYSKEARDSKRITDVRNLLNKINIEQTRGKQLSELIITTSTGEITVNKTLATTNMGKANFENLQENEKNFKDPESGEDYKLAYTEGGEGNNKYSFVQAATISESENVSKVMGNYYVKELGDAPSLFKIGEDSYIVDDGDINGVGMVDTGESTTTREVYGDEDVEAIAACNLWVQNAIQDQAGGYENWVWIPASEFTTDGYGTGMNDDFYKREVEYNGITYTCNGFAVMKYEAKFLTDQRIEADATRKTRTCSDYDDIDGDEYCTTIKTSSNSGDIGSMAGNQPIARIRQGEAIYVCKGITYNGKESHLMTNNEWMSIVRNIEQQTNNWSSGVVGNGFMYNGHNDAGPAQALEASTDDNDGYYLTGDSATVKDGKYNGYISENVELAYKGQRRTHTLSNSATIWDLSGNVWEHVNKSNLPTTSNLRTTNTWNNPNERKNVVCSNVTTEGFYGYLADTGVSTANITACDFTNDYTYENIGPKTANLTAANGIGRIWTRGSDTATTNASNVFLRGAAVHHGPSSGIFALLLNVDATSQIYDGGFRCAF